VNLQPARIDPIFVPRIWGARSLAPFFPAPQIENEPIGEVWLTGSECPVAGGPFAGRSLGQAWRKMDSQWRGARLGDETIFPLLVKFLFPEDRLSVQVHPHDEYAQRHEASFGGRGKTEMWYVLEARAGGEVMVGLRPGVTPESFRSAIEAGAVEDSLQRIPLRAGDAVFVPAGAAHAIGPGLVLCEIQEHSDLTYRIFDYNRLTHEGKPRTLHIEKALEVLNFGEQIGGKLQAVETQCGPRAEAFYIACPYFATERWEFREPVATVTDPEHFDLLIFLAGSGKIDSSSGSQSYAPAQCWLIPAALGAYQLVPANHTSLLRTYVPRFEEFAQRLLDRGIPEEKFSRLVYR